jgi:hypothetical protein
MFGFDLSHKRATLPDEIRADIEAVKRIKSLHRTVNTPSNVLCVRGQKNFKNIEKSAYKAFFHNDKDPKKATKAVKEDPKKANKKDKDSKMPIIIVPAATQALLNLYNVKEFLIDSSY